MDSMQMLRRLTPAENDFATQNIVVTDVPTTFTTGVSGEYGRKHLYAYSITNSSSGELYYGKGGVSASTGFPIAKGVFTEIPIESNQDVYFVAETGEQGTLRLLELA